MNNYSVESYIKDIRNVVSVEETQKSITERIKPLAQRLAAEKSWIKPEYYNVNDEQGFGLHLLHEEEDHRLAVFVIAWAPGKGLAPIIIKRGQLSQEFKDKNMKLIIKD